MARNSPPDTLKTMPIYAYKCDACGHAKDVLQKISDPLLSVCPACAAAAFTKQLTAAGFQLKGSGWYVTDFRNGNAAAGKAADGTKTGDTPAAGTATADAAASSAAPSAKSAPESAPAAAPAASASASAASASASMSAAKPS